MLRKLLITRLDPNNVLAHAVAGIPLDSESCSPNGSAAESSMEIVVPGAVPTHTVTLEVREEFQWPGWNHGPYNKRVTITRSSRAATITMTSAPSCQSNPFSCSSSANHGILNSFTSRTHDHLEYEGFDAIQLEHGY